MMIARQLILQLHSPVYFVSLEYGSESKTSDILSHYSIMYALNDRENGVSYATIERIEEGRNRKRPPLHYESFGIFSTAAIPLKIVKRRYIYNTRPEHYFFWDFFSRGAVRSLRINRLNFPVFGSREVILPESEFSCWVLSKTERHFPEIVTIGKKRGLARVFEKRTVAVEEEREGTFRTPGPLLYDHLIQNKEEILEGKFSFAGHLIYVDGRIEGRYYPFDKYGIPCSLLERL